MKQVICLHSIWSQQLTDQQRRKCRPIESLNHLNFGLFETKSYYVNFYGTKTFSWKSVTSKMYSLVVCRNVSQCLTLGTTWGWVWDNRIVIFWWTIPYNDVATFCRNRKIDANGAYKCPLSPDIFVRLSPFRHCRPRKRLCCVHIVTNYVPICIREITIIKTGRSNLRLYLFGGLGYLLSRKVTVAKHCRGSRYLCA